MTVKNYRFIALLGDGRERFSDKDLDKEWPTEPVVIDAFGFSDVYRYSGVVFLNEEWFTKYSKNSRVNLVKYAVKDFESENLSKIKAYLASPPEGLEESIAVWKSFYDRELKTI